MKNGEIFCDWCGDSINANALENEYVELNNEIICKCCVEAHMWNADTDAVAGLVEERESDKCDCCHESLSKYEMFFEDAKHDLIMCDCCIENEVREYDN